MPQALSKSSTTHQEKQGSNSKNYTSKSCCNNCSSFFYSTSNPMFSCKQFNINDNGATMKIGNDAIMLGAIAQPSLLPQHILDIGTGCGILALMMSQRFPIANITAIDIDRQTTQVAAANFENSPWSNRLYALNVPLQDFATKSDRQYDLIISNPPYVRSADMRKLDRSVRDFEPSWALDGGKDGLKFYKSIIKYWKSLLRPGGYLLFEVGEGQAESVKEMLLTGGFRATGSKFDTLGVERVVIGKM